MIARHQQHRAVNRAALVDLIAVAMAPGAHLLDIDWNLFDGKALRRNLPRQGFKSANEVTIALLNISLGNGLELPPGFGVVPGHADGAHATSPSGGSPRDRRRSSRNMSIVIVGLTRRVPSRAANLDILLTAPA
jgi:hypothetical protein